MAPPANRRSGYSRRAQYSIFFSYAAGVVGALLGVILLAVSFFQPSLFDTVRTWAADLVAPAGQATASARNSSRDSFQVIAGFFKAGSEHAKLERELAEAKVRLVRAQAVDVENRRLKGLLGLSTQEPRPVATAMLTSSTAASTRRLATLSAGRDKGVENGMPVRSAMGLVGRVLNVGLGTSRVLLITDTESLVPVRRARDAIA